MKNKTLDYAQMICGLNCLLALGGICQSLMALNELPSARASFKSLFRILKTLY